VQILSFVSCVLDAPTFLNLPRRTAHDMLVLRGSEKVLHVLALDFEVPAFNMSHYAQPGGTNELTGWLLAGYWPKSCETPTGTANHPLSPDPA